MYLRDVLSELINSRHATYRQSWRNKQKAVMLVRGQMCVVYKTRAGAWAQSRYMLQTADIKAADWVLIELPSGDWDDDARAVLENVLPRA